MGLTLNCDQALDQDLWIWIRGSPGHFNRWNILIACSWVELAVIDLLLLSSNVCFLSEKKLQEKEPGQVSFFISNLEYQLS